MPPKRRYRRKPASRGKNYGAAAGQLYKDVKYLKSLINVEKKYIIKDQTSTNVVQSFTGHDINTGIARNDSYDGRDGASVKGSYIQVRGRISYNPSYAATAQTVRLALVGKNMVTGTTCDDTAIWTAGVGNNPCLKWYEPNEMTGYQILKDKHYTVTAERPDLYFKISRKINHHAEWNIGDATGALANMTKGLFTFFYASDASINYPTIEFSTKYKYIDN